MISFYGDPASYGNDLVWQNVWLSLSIRRGDFFPDPSFGSRLHLVKTAGDSDLMLIEQYCREALAWMVTAGRAVEITVAVSATIPGRADITVNVTKSGDKTVPYRFFKRVI